MQEILPIVSGLVLGAALGMLPSMRARVGAFIVLTVGFGVLVYRPRFLRHRIGAYAASAAMESWASRMALGGRKPCRSISQLAL